MAKGATELPFVHLRTRSAYSLLEGAITIPRIAHLATTNRMPAIALTDTGNLFGALEFSEAIWAAGIQPIIGCALSVMLQAPEEDGRNGWHESVKRAARGGDGALALLVKDEQGYQNLMRLSSKAFLEHEDAGGYFVTFDDIANHHEGLIALTGGPDGPVDRALVEGDGDKADKWLTKLAELFGDQLYVELQRHGLEEERRVEPQLLAQAIERKLPVVATNDVFFAQADEYEAHDALICISEGSYIDVEDRRRLSPEHYFKSADQMRSLFADLPEAIDNTWEVARRCAFRPEVRQPILPKFASASGEAKNAPPKDEAAELRRQAEDGLEHRLAGLGAAEGTDEDAYRSRLEHELDIITGMDYAGYFLIVADFIKWAKRAGIPVGPGRGSGAGSVVAWALTITDLDPLRFGLLFERFLNPERVSMPDFDIDFCQDRRDEVIRYVQETYGEDRVAQIITFGKLQARAVLRDVGRVLHMPYGQVDRLCKLIPYNPANPVTLEQAINGEPRLQEARDEEPIVARLLDIALRLEGLYRHASTHAAGVVIGDRPLIELVPLYRDPRSSLPATQFNMKWVEAAGLVKFDFLGLKTLTVIEKTVEMVARRGTKIDPAHLPFDDDATYQLLARAETVGVFQLEGSGMRDSLRKLKPDRFEDIIAMVALYRPGPMDNIETYANRKHGLEDPDYLHPMIRPVLEETYGVIIYQEQVMQIAQTLSGFSLGEADLLRRAMGKKIKSEMDKQKSRFIEGAIANGVEKPRAEYIFELVAKFAGYGFNKSHAAAYALLAYQTAYLKANHPVEFLAASMTLDMGNTDKLNQFVQEARRGGITVEPPSVNVSEADFVPADKAIRYSLAALKNMGHAAAEQIQAERESNGPYENVTDFARRLNPRAVTKRSVEALITAGALDELGADRATLFAGADRILATANRSSDDRARGQNDLFGAGAQKELRLAECESWLPIDRLRREFEAVGFFLSGHPLDEYKTALDRLGVETWANFSARVRSAGLTGTLAGTVIYRQERKSRSGNQFAFVGFSDQSGEFEALAFSETLVQSRSDLEVGNPLLIRMEAEPDGDVIKARVLKVEPLDKAAMRIQDGLEIVMEDPDRLDVLSRRLSSEGDGKVWLVLRLGDVDREVEFAIPGGYDTSPTEAGAIRHIKGIAQVTPR